jgi:hypothetical protein
MSGWTPSIVPNKGDDDHNVYLVLDDFGQDGRAWRESFANVAMSRCGTFHLSCKTLSTGMRVGIMIINCPCPCANLLNSGTAMKWCARCDNCR